MNGSSRLIVAFSIAFALLFLAPPFLTPEFGVYPLMRLGDVVDILTPLALIPLYWLLYRMQEERSPTLSGVIIFLVLAGFWVEGQGMHLSANSIGHLLEEMEGSDVYNLTNFYDEVLSHYLWHFGIVGLSAVLIFRQRQTRPADERIVLWPTGLAGIIHGFTFFLIVVEAGTAPLGLPFAILVVLLILLRRRKGLSQKPILAFFFAAYLVAIVLFAAWAIYWGSLPQFSEVGII